MEFQQESNHAGMNHNHLTRLVEKPIKLMKKSNDIQTNSLTKKTSITQFKPAENHAVSTPEYESHNPRLKSFQSPQDLIEKGLNQRFLEEGDPLSYPITFTSNHMSKNHMPVKVDVESVLRTPSRESAEKSKSVNAHKSAFKTISETTLTRTPDVVSNQNDPFVKETTFSVKPKSRSSKYVSSLSLHNLNIPQPNQVVNVDDDNQDTSSNKFIFNDPSHCAKTIGRSFPNHQECPPKFNDVLSPKTCRGMPLSNSTPNVIEMDSFYNDSYYHFSPNSKGINIENESFQFDTIDKRSFQRTNPKTKFKRNSGTRRAQRRKRINCVIHNKARRNSAILAKVTSW